MAKLLLLLTGTHSTGKPCVTEEQLRLALSQQQNYLRIFLQPHTCNSAATAQLNNINTNEASNTAAKTIKKGIFMTAPYFSRYLRSCFQLRQQPRQLETNNKYSWKILEDEQRAKSGLFPKTHSPSNTLISSKRFWVKQNH